MDRIEQITLAYLKAYKIALRETKNPMLSSQIASSVMFIMKDEFTAVSSLGEMLAALAQKVSEEKEKEEE